MKKELKVKSQEEREEGVSEWKEKKKEAEKEKRTTKKAMEEAVRGREDVVDRDGGSKNTISRQERRMTIV